MVLYKISSLSAKDGLLSGSQLAVRLYNLITVQVEEEIRDYCREVLAGQKN